MFPHRDPFEFAGQMVSVEWVERQLAPLLTADRLQKIQKVVAGRTYSITAVLEDIYDRGNTSAVMRSAEAMGIQSVHHIELSEAFKSSKRVTKGADKWLDQYRHKSTKEAISFLKESGYQLVVTDLEAEQSIDEVDFTKPTALVLGNEKEGASEEMKLSADHRVVIPMSGFVESFNISVAAALAFFHISQARGKRHGDMSESSQKILQAIYCCRSNVDMTLNLLSSTAP